MMIGGLMPRSPTSSTICFRATPRSGSRVGSRVISSPVASPGSPPLLRRPAISSLAIGHLPRRLGCTFHAASEPDIELRRRQRDAAGGEGLVDQVIELAPERTRAVEQL